MLQTLDRLRAEFLEMPGLRLTAQQAQRLCGLEPTICQALLDALVDARFLCRKADGAYARASDGDVEPPHPAALTRPAAIPFQSHQG